MSMTRGSGSRWDRLRALVTASMACAACGSSMEETPDGKGGTSSADEGGASASGDGAAGCPEQPPSDACSEPLPLSCVYVIEGCPTRFACSPAPIGAREHDPEAAMQNGAPCGDPGKVCEYPEPALEHDGSGYERATCASDGKWEADVWHCANYDVGPCPETAPTDGTVCSRCVVGTCHYPSPTCPLGQRSAECVDGRWAVSDADCV